MRRAWLTLLAATGGTLAAVIPAAAPASAAAPAPPQVRVNQVGYPADGPKAAFAMLPRKVASVRFEVVTPYGVAYRGVSAADMAAQLRAGQAQAKGDPFALGTQLGASDASPHAFGLFITDALYQEYGGSDPSGQLASFAQQQLNFALGANGWGASFVVGAGTAYPHCMQSEIANLAGSLTGTGTIQLGATTDGPSDPSNFVGLSTVDGMRACSAGHFAPFNTKAAAYEDNVVSWPSVEPADDYTANSLMAFALGAAGLG